MVLLTLALTFLVGVAVGAVGLVCVAIYALGFVTNKIDKKTLRLLSDASSKTSTVPLSQEDAHTPHDNASIVLKNRDGQIIEQITSSKIHHQISSQSDDAKLPKHNIMKVTSKEDYENLKLQISPSSSDNSSLSNQKPGNARHSVSIQNAVEFVPIKSSSAYLESAKHAHLPSQSNSNQNSPSPAYFPTPPLPRLGIIAKDDSFVGIGSLTSRKEEKITNKTISSSTISGDLHTSNILHHPSKELFHPNRRQNITSSASGAAMSLGESLRVRSSTITHTSPSNPTSLPSVNQSVINDNNDNTPSASKSSSDNTKSNLIIDVPEHGSQDTPHLRTRSNLKKRDLATSIELFAESQRRHELERNKKMLSTTGVSPVNSIPSSNPSNNLTNNPRSSTLSPPLSGDPPATSASTIITPTTSQSETVVGSSASPSSHLFSGLSVHQRTSLPVHSVSNQSTSASNSNSKLMSQTVSSLESILIGPGHHHVEDPTQSAPERFPLPLKDRISSKKNLTPQIAVPMRLVKRETFIKNARDSAMADATKRKVLIEVVEEFGILDASSASGTPIFVRININDQRFKTHLSSRSSNSTLPIVSSSTTSASSTSTSSSQSHLPTVGRAKWGTIFVARVDNPHIDRLEFEVWNRERFSLGQTHMLLSDLLKDCQKDVWLPMKGLADSSSKHKIAAQGELHVIVTMVSWESTVALSKSRGSSKKEKDNAKTLPSNISTSISKGKSDSNASKPIKHKKSSSNDLNDSDTDEEDDKEWNNELNTEESSSFSGTGLGLPQQSNSMISSSSNSNLSNNNNQNHNSSMRDSRRSSVNILNLNSTSSTQPSSAPGSTHISNTSTNLTPSDTPVTPPSKVSLEASNVKNSSPFSQAISSSSPPITPHSTTESIESSQLTTNAQLNPSGEIMVNGVSQSISILPGSASLAPCLSNHFIPVPMIDPATKSIFVVGMQGWLNVKLNFKQSKYESRWCVLNGNSLTISEDMYSEAPLAVVKIFGSSVKKVPTKKHHIKVTLAKDAVTLYDYFQIKPLPIPNVPESHHISPWFNQLSKAKKLSDEMILNPPQIQYHSNSPSTASIAPTSTSSKQSNNNNQSSITSTNSNLSANIRNSRNSISTNSSSSASTSQNSSTNQQISHTTSNPNANTHAGNMEKSNSNSRLPKAASPANSNPSSTATTPRDKLLSSHTNNPILNPSNNANINETVSNLATDLTAQTETEISASFSDIDDHLDDSDDEYLDVASSSSPNLGLGIGESLHTTSPFSLNTSSSSLPKKNSPKRKSKLTLHTAIPASGSVERAPEEQLPTHLSSKARSLLGVAEDGSSSPNNSPKETSSLKLNPTTRHSDSKEQNGQEIPSIASITLTTTMAHSSSANALNSIGSIINDKIMGTSTTIDTAVLEPGKSNPSTGLKDDLAIGASAIAHAGISFVGGQQDEMIEYIRKEQDDERRAFVLANGTPLKRIPHSIESHDAGFLNLILWRLFKDMQTSELFANDVSEKIKGKLETVKLPPFLGNLRVMDIDYGRDFLKAQSIKVVATEVPNEIIAEADVTYDGGLTVQLGIECYINWPRPKSAIIPVTAKIKLAQLKGKIHIHCPGELNTKNALCFVTPPMVDFDVSIDVGRGEGKRVSSIPKLKQFLFSFARQAAFTALVHPSRIRWFWPIPGRKVDVELETLKDQAKVKNPSKGVTAVLTRDTADVVACKYVATEFFEKILNQYRYERLDQLFVADCLVHGTNFVDVPYRGRDAILHWIVTLRNALPDIRFYIEELNAARTNINIQWVARGTFKADLWDYPATNEELLLRGSFAMKKQIAALSLVIFGIR